MTNYVLIYGGGGMAETDAAQAAEMEHWNQWYGTMGEAVVDGGNPFGPMAKTIDGSSVSDTPQSAMASGYTIIAADSMDAAVAMAKGCPILKSGGHVTVYETFQVM